MNFSGMDLLSPEFWAHAKAVAITLAALVACVLIVAVPGPFFACAGIAVWAVVLYGVYRLALDHFSFKE